MADHEILWTAVAQLLKDQVSEAVWYSTFHDIVALESDPSMLRLDVPNAPVRDRIMSRYLPLVRDALEDLGEGNRELVLEVAVVPVAVAVASTGETNWTPVYSAMRTSGNGTGLLNVTVTVLPPAGAPCSSTA